MPQICEKDALSEMGHVFPSLTFSILRWRGARRPGGLIGWIFP
jgi:hypothetical protein